MKQADEIYVLVLVVSRKRNLGRIGFHDELNVEIV